VSAPRLILVDSVVVDVVLNVELLPERGSDTLVERSDSFAGEVSTSWPPPLDSDWPRCTAGSSDSDRFATIAQEAMRLEDIVVATPPIDDVDTGFVVAIVEDGGERTFLTSVGAEATLSTGQLDELDVSESDLVYFSGYALLHESKRPRAAQVPHTDPRRDELSLRPRPDRERDFRIHVGRGLRTRRLVLV